MEPDRRTAEAALQEASRSNPGPWTEHSRYVALACHNIALRCANLDFPCFYDPGNSYLHWQIRCQ